MPVRPIEWVPETPNSLVPGQVNMIDQTLLPCELRNIVITDLEAMCEAIKMLRVRGAPAIGVAAVMGIVIAVQQADDEDAAAVRATVASAGDKLAATRPTAVNLFKGIAYMNEVAEAGVDMSANDLREELASKAMAFFEEDREMCRSIGVHGAELLEDGDTVLTHCNAGSLATSEYGTALAPIYVAKDQGKTIHVYSDETRPLLQGSRLTAWELMQSGINVTVICDNMAAHVMREKKVNAVFVGADRIAANGDAANKIGTYGLALVAKAHNVPFYVLAPTSTFDMTLSSGTQIPIEERGPEEIVMGFGKQTAPDGVRVYSPAFDVTPADLIAGIICEHGIARGNYTEELVRYTAM